MWREIRDWAVASKYLMCLHFFRKIAWPWRISIKTKVLATSFPILQVIYCAIILGILPLINVSKTFLRASLHETRSELKPVWNLKPLWNVVPFTWQFTERFHCGIFPNNSKTLLHMGKWYLWINANLVNTKKCNQDSF